MARLWSPTRLHRCRQEDPDVDRDVETAAGNSRDERHCPRVIDRRVTEIIEGSASGRESFRRWCDTAGDHRRKTRAIVDENSLSGGARVKQWFLEDQSTRVIK